MENMASLTSSTPRGKIRSRDAFTLVEVLVGATVSSFLMTGMLAAFLFMGRTGANVANYTVLETAARKALEQFSSEVHQAYAVGSGYSSTSVTLSIPDNTSSRIPANPTANGAYTVTYTYDATNKMLTRAINGGAATPYITNVGLVSGVPFFSYYKYVNAGTMPISGQGYHDYIETNTAASLAEIRQIEVSFLLSKKDQTVNEASNKVLSARFILRNK